MRIKAVLGPSLKIMDPSSEKSKNRSDAGKNVWGRDFPLAKSSASFLCLLLPATKRNNQEPLLLEAINRRPQTGAF
jgi:hypothetical protein